MLTNDPRVIRVTFEHFNIPMEGRIYRAARDLDNGDTEEMFVTYFEAYRDDSRVTSALFMTVPEAMAWIFEKSLDVRREAKEVA